MSMLACFWRLFGLWKGCPGGQGRSPVMLDMKWPNTSMTETHFACIEQQQVDGNADPQLGLVKFFSSKHRHLINLNTLCYWSKTFHFTRKFLPAEIQSKNIFVVLPKSIFKTKLWGHRAKVTRWSTLMSSPSAWPMKYAYQTQTI